MTVPFTNLDKVFLGGEWHAPGGGKEAVVNPATETLLAEAPVADLAQVDAAIAAARQCVRSWPLAANEHGRARRHDRRNGPRPCGSGSRTSQRSSSRRSAARKA